MSRSDFQLLKSARKTAIGLERSISQLENKYDKCKHTVQQYKKEIPKLQSQIDVLQKKVESAKNDYGKKKKEFDDQVKEVNLAHDEFMEQTEPFLELIKYTLGWTWGIGIPLMAEYMSGTAREDGSTIGGNIAGIGCVISFLLFLVILGLDKGTHQEKEKLTVSSSPEAIELNRLKSAYSEKKSELSKMKKTLSPMVKSTDKANSDMKKCLVEIKELNEQLHNVWKSVEHLIP